MSREKPSIDERAVLDLIMELLPITGLTGREGKVMDWIVARLRKSGIPASAIRFDSAHKRSPLGGEVGNLVCKLPGTMRAPRRLLMSHVDTVPICAGTKPVQKGDYVVSGNPQTGLGADNRSGSAAILNAVTQIARDNLPHPPLTILWTVQEENGLFGARFGTASLLGNPKLCFNWDGNEPQTVIIGATGAYRMQILIRGIASHAGVHPEHGASAIAMAGLAIARLHEQGWHGLIQKGRRAGTSNIGIIEGGSANNVVANETRVRAEARSHDPKFRKKILDTIRTTFEKAARSVKNQSRKGGAIEFAESLDYESFQLDPATPSVAEAIRVIKSLGMKPEHKIANGGLDANWMTARGFPTVTLGTGQQHIHTVAERLNIPFFQQGCQVALRLATGG